MKYIKKYIWSVLLFLSLSSYAGNLKLWYNKPAFEWTEALGTEVEELQLNEETFWAGSPYRNDNPDALKVLPEVRRLIFSGRYKEAQDLVNKNFLTPRNGMPYQTIGSLMINFQNHKNATDYYRELDIEKAVASVSYKVDGVTYKRELFSSIADNVVIMRISCSEPGKLSFGVSFNCPLEHKVSVKNKCLYLKAKANDHEGVPGKLFDETLVKAVNDGGKVSFTDNTLKVDNADSVTLYISSATNFINYKDISGNAYKKAVRYLNEAVKKDYVQAKEEHIRRYSEMFSRLNLEISSDDYSNEPTDRSYVPVWSLFTYFIVSARWTASKSSGYME